MVETGTRGENILDLVLTNKDDLVSNLILEAPLGSSDHDAINFEISDIKNKPKNMKKLPNFKKTNFTIIREEMNKIDWNAQFANFLQ